MCHTIFVMPIVTQIAIPRRSPNRRKVYLDGQPAFTCNITVIARFRLREGLDLTDEQVQQIQQGEVRQECMDHALGILQRRLHSRAELHRKLSTREYPLAMIDDVLDQLTQMSYVDDARFAHVRAQAAAENRHHGPRRALLELRKTGINSTLAEQTIQSIYDQQDPVAIAMKLAGKQAPRLKKLDPPVARRRLAGLLQRRGFDYDTIQAVTRKILGDEDQTND